MNDCILCALENIMHEFENTGLILLNELNTLNDRNIIKKLIQIVGDKHEGLIKQLNETLDKGCVTRTITSMQCQSIKIAFYDAVLITDKGIYYEPEHGHKREVLSFNDDIMYIINPKLNGIERAIK